MGFFADFFRNVAAAPGCWICDRQNSSMSSPSVMAAIFAALGRIEVRREPKSTYSMFLILFIQLIGTGGGRYGLLTLNVVPALA